MEYEEEKRCYRLHDLLFDYAHDKLRASGTGVNLLRFRHARHYVMVAQRADECYLRGGEGVLEGLRAFDLDWPHIRAGQTWAAQNYEDDFNAAILCVAYPDAGTYCLGLRLSPLELVHWRTDAVNAARTIAHTERVDAARKIALRSLEGNHLGSLGVAYKNLGVLTKAVECLESALAIARELRDKGAEGTRLGNLANTYTSLGKHHKAIELHEEALRIAREIGDKRGESSRLANLGAAFASNDEPLKAIAYYEQALPLAREIGDKRGEASHLSNAGRLYHAAGQTQKAFEYFEQALRITREIGDRAGEANTLRNLAMAHEKEHRLSDARRCFESALALYDAMGAPEHEGIRRHLAQLPP